MRGKIRIKSSRKVTAFTINYSVEIRTKEIHQHPWTWRYDFSSFFSTFILRSLSLFVLCDFQSQAKLFFRSNAVAHTSFAGDIETLVNNSACDGDGWKNTHTSVKNTQKRMENYKSRLEWENTFGEHFLCECVCVSVRLSIDLKYIQPPDRFRIVFIINFRQQRHNGAKASFACP